MTRKKFWIAFAVAAVFVPVAMVAYWMFPQWDRIPDVTRTTELVLYPRKHQHNLYAFEIHVSGEIAGKAELLWVEAGKAHRVLELSGTVDAHFVTDWYAGNADAVTLTYKPIHVTGGSLTVRYSFMPWYPTNPL